MEAPIRLALLCAVACASLAGAGAATATPARAPALKPVIITIVVQKGRPVGGIKRPTVKRGKVVRIVIRADRGEEVHLHGYEVEKPIRVGRATTLQFTARVAGRFELEMHNPDAVLAEITVKP